MRGQVQECAPLKCMLDAFGVLIFRFRIHALARPMTPLVFSHGNSFPGGTYSVLFEQLRARGYSVAAIDRFGHDPEFPVTSNWPHLVKQLAQFATTEVERAGQPVFLVGHSLGGIVSIMTAALHPALVRGVVMLDSPLISGWKANAVSVAKRAQMVGAVSPGKISRRRRHQWPDLEAALAHFSRKKAFMDWEPQVLRDYMTHGFQEDAGQWTLRFDRDVETAIYNTLPHNLVALLKKNPLRCPAAFIGGLASVEMQQVGTAFTHRVVKGRITMIDGTHLFPMERPAVTAAAIEAALLNLSATQVGERS